MKQTKPEPKLTPRLGPATNVRPAGAHKNVYRPEDNRVAVKAALRRGDYEQSDGTLPSDDAFDRTTTS